jgi:tetratricopeptide (TPR) repeat protein
MLRSLNANVFSANSMMNIPTDTNLHSLAHAAALLLRSGRMQEAESVYRKILELDSENREALFITAQLLKSQGKESEAGTYERRFLALGPTQSDVHIRMGRFLHVLGKYAEAESAYRKAMELGCNSVELYRSMGDVFLDNGDAAEALNHYQKALKLQPGSAPTHALMAEAYRLLNRLDDALLHARKAIAIDPSLQFSKETVASTLLAQGNYESGWLLKESRFDSANAVQLDQMGIAQLVESFSTKPRWRGEDLKGQTLLVWSEQGAGDNFMMMRYLPLLKQKGAGAVIVYCEASLVKIMLAMTSLVVDKQLGLPKDTFDLQCSTMSLPYLFGTRTESIPASVPYLNLPPAASRKWGEQLKKFPGLKVGIVWAGNKTMTRDRLRSVSLESLAPLMVVPGVQFVSLQKDEATHELAAHGGRILDWMEACDDWSDTAALIASLDLVIGVDTAIVHLAGALGKPVWLLNRFESEWRWLIDRDDSPWYPTMRIFRQPEIHDWASVIERVASELGKLAPIPAVETIGSPEWDKAAQSARRSLGIGSGDKENAAQSSGKWSLSKLWRR